MEKVYLTEEVATLVAMAREGEWLCADACAFLLGMRDAKGQGEPPRLSGARCAAR